MLKDKLGFFTRLLENCFTKKIIFELYECNKTNSYLKDVCTLLFQSDKTIQNPNLLILLTNIEICKIDSKEKAKAQLDNKVMELHSAFKIKNYELFIKKIWSIIGY
jgi:hypothetical protein